MARHGKGVAGHLQGWGCVPCMNGASLTLGTKPGIRAFSNTASQFTSARYGEFWRSLRLDRRLSGSLVNSCTQRGQTGGHHCAVHGGQRGCVSGTSLRTSPSVHCLVWGAAVCTPPRVAGR